MSEPGEPAEDDQRPADSEATESPIEASQAKTTGDDKPTGDDERTGDADDVDTSDAPDSDAVADDSDPDVGDPDEDAPDDEAAAEESPIDPGELLFSEPGGSWWVVAIGPVMIAAILAMEISGPGQVHWPVISIFGLIIIGFSVIQVVAARRHVSVELTETTLRQGVRVLPLANIEKIFPANTGAEPKKWESARALGELHGVPRRRKGIGVKLSDGTLAQAWARDVERFRQELTEAHMAVAMGLAPRNRKD